MVLWNQHRFPTNLQPSYMSLRQATVLAGVNCKIMSVFSRSSNCHRCLQVILLPILSGIKSLENQSRNNWNNLFQFEKGPRPSPPAPSLLSWPDRVEFSAPADATFLRILQPPSWLNYLPWKNWEQLNRLRSDTGRYFAERWPMGAGSPWFRSLFMRRRMTASCTLPISDPCERSRDPFLTSRGLHS